MQFCKKIILISACIFTLLTLVLAQEAALPVTPSVSVAEPVTFTAQENTTQTAAVTGTPLPVTPTGFTADFSAAIKKSVESSATIKQALADYNKAKALLEKEKGIYDPYIKAGVSYSESMDKSLALQLPESEKILQYTAGLGSRLLTGGDIRLDFSSSRTALAFPAFSGSVDASLFWPSINPYYYPEIILSYTQPLLKGFWGGAAGMKIQAAEYRVKAAGENLKEKIISRAYGLKAAYNEVYLKDIYIKAAGNYLKDVENTYNKMKSAGKGEADLLLAKAAMMTAKAGIKPAEKVYAAARERYLNLAGYAPSEWAAAVVDAEAVTEDVYVPQEMTEDLLRTLVDLQPGVTAEKYSVLAAETVKNDALNSALPQLNLTGSFGLNGYSGTIDDAFGGMGTGKYGDFMLGADFSWSFPGREGEGISEAQKEELNRARAVYEAVMNELRIKIRAAYSGITAEKEYYEALKEARLLYERRAKLLQQALDSGSGTARDALLAHLDRFNARKSEAEAFTAYCLAIMDWNRVNGKYDYFYNEYVKDNY